MWTISAASDDLAEGPRPLNQKLWRNLRLRELSARQIRARVFVMATNKTAKDRMLEILGEQPDDSSFDDLLAELTVARMVERGLADSENGETISHEEMIRRVASWPT